MVSHLHHQPSKGEQIVLFKGLGLYRTPPDSSERQYNSRAGGSRFKNNCFAEMRGGFEEGPNFRLKDFCITEL
jgi:hypothetical protein